MAVRPKKKKQRNKRSVRKTKLTTPGEDPRFSHPKFTEQRIAEALEKGAGTVTGAAAVLNCTRTTIYEYMERYPDLILVSDSERNRLIDLGEIGLRKALTPNKPEMWAIKFVLKTLGKRRGYVERHEFAGPDGGGIPLEQRDLSTAHDKMTDAINRISKRLADALPKGKS